MNLLPEIDENGQLILTKEEKKHLSNMTISPEKKKKLSEAMAKIKAKRDLEDVKKVDEQLSELNNEGHKEVTEDFSDSPFADRVEEKDDEE